MEIDDRHHNAQGFVMGGVFFSLADYALAVASNVNQPPSASTNSSIAHMRRVKGNKLKAVAHPDKLGRNLAFFTIDLFDEPRQSRRPHERDRDAHKSLARPAPT